MATFPRACERAAISALYATGSTRKTSCRASCSSTVAAWLPAASRPTTASRLRSRFRPVAGWSRSTIDWRRSTNSPRRIEDAIAAVDFVARNAAALGIDARRARDRRGFRRRNAGHRRLPARIAERRSRHVAQCLICPVLDFVERSPSREAFADNPLIDRVTLEADLSDYLPQGDRPRRSPHLAAPRAGSRRFTGRDHPHRRIRSDAR